MIEIFLCHSRADQHVAATIAARLERSTGLKLWLHACGEEPEELIPVVWDIGLAAAGILLLLSPEAVPRSLSRAAWQSLLDHMERLQPPPIGTVVVRDCPFPLMLRRKSFFVWGEGSNEVLRALERWVIGVYSGYEARTLVPARLPRFAGRERELDELWTRLVDHSGTVAVANPEPGSGKTSLAQQFANAASAHFRDVVWVECGGRSPAFIASDIAALTGGKERRVLVVLDDVRDESPMLATPEGLASVLITTRNSALRLPAHASVLGIDAARAAAPGEPPSAECAGGRLLGAMSVCRPNGFPRELAVAVAGLPADEAKTACERLLAEGWVEPLDAGARRLRLPAHSVQEAAALRRSHAETVCAVFREHRTAPEQSAETVAELEHALGWAMEHDWSLATRLARHGFQFLSAGQRFPEAIVLFERLRKAALERGDAEVAKSCAWDLSWIQNDKGEVRRPMTATEQLSLDFS